MQPPILLVTRMWALHNPLPAVPALEGKLLKYIGEPDRFGLPVYELHV